MSHGRQGLGGPQQPSRPGLGVGRADPAHPSPEQPEGGVLRRRGSRAAGGLVTRILGGTKEMEANSKPTAKVRHIRVRHRPVGVYSPGPPRSAGPGCGEAAPRPGLPAQCHVPSGPTSTIRFAVARIMIRVTAWIARTRPRGRDASRNPRPVSRCLRPGHGPESESRQHRDRDLHALPPARSDAREDTAGDPLPAAGSAGDLPGRPAKSTARRLPGRAGAPEVSDFGC